MSDTQQPTRSRLLFKGFAISLPLTLLSACTHFSSTQPSSAAQNNQSLLVYGGPILTMQGMQPTYVEALLIQQGRIRFSGDLAQHPCSVMRIF